MEEARQKHRQGNRHSFDEMMKKRWEFNSQGLPYHNSSFDAMLLKIAEKHNVAMKKPYPYRYHDGVDYL